MRHNFPCSPQVPREGIYPVLSHKLLDNLAHS